MADKRKDKREVKPYQHYEATFSHKVHHIYFSEAIREPAQYIDIVHKLKTAQPDDVFYFYLNFPGGWLKTGAQIVNAIQATPAYVIASIEAEAHSLATLIFLAADEFIVHDNCTMMFHNYSGGVAGKGHEQQAQLEATIEWYNTLARKLSVPFLSEEEFDRVTRGEDIWMQSDEIRERLDNMVAIIKEQKEKEQKEKESEESEKQQEQKPKTKRASRKKVTTIK